MTNERFVEVGAWRTLESFWARQARAVFRRPAGAEIKIRYGAWWLAWDSQHRTLDGVHPKELKVGWASVVVARMQMTVPRSTEVVYEIYRASASRPVAFRTGDCERVVQLWEIRAQ